MPTSIDIIVHHKVGLHARPAALFVKTANDYKSEITVENLTSKTSPANGKSILGILGSGVYKEHEIRITAMGDDENEAIAALRDLIESKFGEA